MATDFDFNPLTGGLDLITVDGSIPQYSADPASPVAQTAWVRKTGGGSGTAGKLKAIFGLGFPLVETAGVGATYELSYRTIEGTTVRVPLT